MENDVIGSFSSQGICLPLPSAEHRSSIQIYKTKKITKGSYSSKWYTSHPGTIFWKNPFKCFAPIRRKHSDGKLVLKVTDDKECIKFKTDQAQDAKKMEKLNNIFFTLMARGPEVDISEVGGKEQIEAQPARKARGRKQ